MKTTIERLRTIADGMWEHPKCAELYKIADEIERHHATDQETIARLMNLTDDEREAGRDRLLAAVRGGSHDDNTACDRCGGTGSETVRTIPPWPATQTIPCRKCGERRR